MSTTLFEATKLGDLQLSSRIVMAPMTRCRAIGNVPNALMAEYYGQRASAGLIVTEGVAPSPNGLGYARIPGLFSAEQVEGWKLVTRAVHDKGGKIFAQLMHTGRVSHPDNMPEGAEIVAPSALAAKGEMWTDAKGPLPQPEPRAMQLEDLERAEQAFEDSAAKAIEAGFDGIELHSANGYLLEQFINPTTNQRSDAYGGSIEKRARFVTEVMQRVATRVGAARVGIRWSPYGTFNDMGTYGEVEEQYLHLTEAATSMSLAYVHVIRGKHVNPKTLHKMRQAFSGAFMINAGYDAAQAQADIDSGEADLISFGSSFLANPDLPKRMRIGAKLNAPNPETFYTPGPEGYTDYPTLG